MAHPRRGAAAMLAALTALACGDTGRIGDSARSGGAPADSLRARGAPPEVQDATDPSATRQPPPPPAGPFSFARRVGVLQESRDAGPCLVIGDTSLPPATPLVVVAADAKRQSLTSGRVQAKRERPCTEAGDEWGAVSGGQAGDTAALAFYDVTVVATADTGGGVGGRGGGPRIAITWGAGLVALRGDSAVGDLDGDGRAESFGSCTSHEGIHLSVMGASAGAAARRWHRYYYVPYDLEPSCPGMRDADSSGASGRSPSGR